MSWLLGVDVGIYRGRVTLAKSIEAKLAHLRNKVRMDDGLYHLYAV